MARYLPVWQEGLTGYLLAEGREYQILHLKQNRNNLDSSFFEELINGPVVQLDRISDFGSEGWGFESSLGHNKKARF